jgi:hypothetical protein
VALLIFAVALAAVGTWAIYRVAFGPAAPEATRYVWAGALYEKAFLVVWGSIGLAAGLGLIRLAAVRIRMQLR